ncbi:MAG: 3-hydroxyacyl-CoA dehydrogenase family protein [Marinifilaceae bacterium]
MNLSQKLEKVSVLGAAGKMGSGILVLLAIEMGKYRLSSPEKSKEYVLNAIDVSNIALYNLIEYVRKQLEKHAEKRIVEMRQLYREREDLVENGEVIQEYVNDILGMIKTSTRLEATYDSNLVFEAIKEDKDLKIKLFSQIRDNNPNVLILTNTSSIPIGEIDREGGLNGQIIGFHFYNPPVVQKLLEIIKAENTQEELAQLAEELAKSMRKVIVYSSDKAGFIGNGHFMRDALYALNKAEELSIEMGWAKAIYMIDMITRDLLLRPMGIFQLIDYVGIDVTRFILQSMQPSFPDEILEHFLLNTLMDQSVTGGQYADGSQKDGFFKYEKGRIVEVYDPKSEEYQVAELVKVDCLEKLGTLPGLKINWRMVVRDANKKEVLEKFFRQLRKLDSMGAELAIDYGRNSGAIAKMLVDTDVAATEQDVNTVLETGFYHAYGPINEYFN